MSNQIQAIESTIPKDSPIESFEPNLFLRKWNVQGRCGVSELLSESIPMLLFLLITTGFSILSAILFVISIPLMFVPLPFAVITLWLTLWACVKYGPYVYLRATTATIRRLHDTDKSIKHLYWVVVPVVGIFVLLYNLLLEPGTAGGNKYGQPESHKYENRSGGYAYFKQELSSYLNEESQDKGGRLTVRQFFLSSVNLASKLFIALSAVSILSGILLVSIGGGFVKTVAISVYIAILIGFMVLSFKLIRGRLMDTEYGLKLFLPYIICSLIGIVFPVLGFVCATAGVVFAFSESSTSSELVSLYMMPQI